ncbi:hypothetical protein [Nocardia aurea]|uniref:DUF308 domain-containing protein n=1 Tax=Nocardia aurea TaxID=2144174 RepID=A0ABV3FYA3_9NOCA
MDMADEIRARRAAEAAQKDGAISQARNRWATTVRTIDVLAPDAARACADLAIPTSTFAGRSEAGWLLTVTDPAERFGNPSRMHIAVYPDGTWELLSVPADGNYSNVPGTLVKHLCVVGKESQGNLWLPDVDAARTAVASAVDSLQGLWELGSFDKPVPERPQAKWIRNRAIARAAGLGLLAVGPIFFGLTLTVLGLIGAAAGLFFIDLKLAVHGRRENYREFVGMGFIVGAIIGAVVFSGMFLSSLDMFFFLVIGSGVLGYLVQTLRRYQRTPRRQTYT